MRLPCDGHGDPDAALLETLAGRARREEQEGPLRAEQIGDGHGAQLCAVEAIGRKRDRNAEDRAPDPVLAEHGPERLGLAQQAQLGPPAGYPVASQPEEPLDAAEVRGRQQGQVGAPVAVEEVEDVVSPRLGAGAERRPCDRRDRRERGPQSSIAAHLRELLEIRQQPLLHEPIGEHRVLAVETDDDEPADEGARRLAAAQAPPEHAERPEEQRRQRGERRREEREERRQQREARAGSDVRIGGLRRARRAARARQATMDRRRPTPQSSVELGQRHARGQGIESVGQHRHDALDTLGDREGRGVERQVGRDGHVVGRAHARKVEKLAGVRSRVAAGLVPRAADLERRREVDLDETFARDGLPRPLPNGRARRDEGADADQPGLVHEPRHVDGTAQVLGPLGRGEPQALADGAPHLQTIEDRHGAAHLEQPAFERVGDRRLAGPWQAGQKDGERRVPEAARALARR